MTRLRVTLRRCRNIAVSCEALVVEGSVSMELISRT